MAGLAERNQVPSLAGAALRCRGLADDDAGTLAAAVQAYQGGTRPLELAGACEDAGAAYARHGMAGRARPLLEQALAIYEQLDAGRDLARAEAVLRQAGLRRGRRGPRGRPKFGWPSLTPAEQAVASLVADGLTNPQIGAGCTSPAGPCRPTWSTCSPSSTSPPAPSSPPRSPATASRSRPPPPVGTVTGTGRIG